MKEIRDKISQLGASYQRQLQLYEQIRVVGSQERELIDRGELDQLLQVLQEKEEILRKAGLEENKIKSIQHFLAKHFDLKSFSLPQLKTVASSRYQADIAVLEEIIGELIPLLETLEEQERGNESLLNSYLAAAKTPSAGGLRQKQAKRAYGPKKE